VCRLSCDRLLPLAAGHCLNSAVSLLKCTALLQTVLSVSFFRMYKKAPVVEYTGMFYPFLAQHYS